MKTVNKVKLYKECNMAHPTLKEFIKFVEEHDKRIGLRMLYKKYEVPQYDREKFRRAWNLIEERIDNASEKRQQPEGNKPEHKDAEERGVSAGPGSSDSDEQSGQEEQQQQKKEAVQEEKEKVSA